MLIQAFLLAFPWARSLPVLLIRNSIREVLPHLNHLLTRSRGKPPAKPSSMQINASVEVALLLLFGLLFIRHFQGATFLLFSFLHFKKSFTWLCFARWTAYVLKIVAKGFGLAIPKHCQNAILLSLYHQRVLAQWLESPPTQGQQISSKKKCFFCFEPTVTGVKYAKATRERQ